MLAWVAASALAGDVESWFGGQVTTGLQEQQGVGPGTILSQAEFDARASTGPLYFRLDLDYHFDPFNFAGSNPDYKLTPAFPLPPEEALVQVGSKYHLRLGVTNADMGIQGWDEKDNYLPSYSSIWALQNGQNLGAEPGISFDDGTNLFVFGGYDLGYLMPGFGGGVSTGQDSWGTYSGFFYRPADQFGMLLTANEIYPADWLTLTLELDAGPAGKGFYGGGEFIATVQGGDSPIGGAVRVDEQWMNDAAVKAVEDPMDATAVSAAANLNPTDTLHLALEGKESIPRAGGDPYFTATLLVSVFTPEPEDDYAVHDPPDEE